MAHYHLQAHNISRRGGTAASASKHRSGSQSRAQNALSASVYRNGQSLKNEQTGDWHQAGSSTYSLRIVSSSMMFPDCTPDRLRNRHALWNEVELRDTRINSRLAKDYDIALPFSWPQRLRERVVRQFVREQFLAKGIAAEVSFHKFGSSYAPATKAWERRAAEHAANGTPYYEQSREPKDALAPYILTIRKADGSVKEHYEFQPHVHIMCPTRYMTKDGLGAKIEAPRGEYRRGWDQAQLIALRESWATIANMHLPEGQQISALSYKERGIAKEPQINRGMAATKLERMGQETERSQNVVKIKFRNELRQAFPEAAEQQQRRAKMDDRTPEAYVKDLTQEQENIYRELEARIERQEALAARWQQAAKDWTNDTLRQADKSLAQGREYLLDQEAMRRRSAADLEHNQQEEARRRTQGMIADPYLRNAIAIGETVGTPGTWVDKCMAAHGAASAAHLREQDMYRRQLADPKISPEDKQEISLRARIEHLEYRAFYEADLVRTYQVIGGKGHVERAEVMQDRVLEFNMTAVSLKEQHAELLRAREIGLDEKRAVGYDGPERRFTDQQFEQSHAERVGNLRQHGATRRLADRQEQAHAEEREVRDEYEMGRRFDRRQASPSMEQAETGRQKENREERHEGANRVQPARVRPPRDREARVVSDQMLAATEMETERSPRMGRHREEEQERSMGE